MNVLLQHLLDPEAIQVQRGVTGERGVPGFSGARMFV